MPPKKIYTTFGSTTITVPEKMVGYDKNHHLHLWNTLTPKTHRLSYHNHKTAINLQVNPNTTRKIQRVPRTTKYMSYENKNNISNGGGGANGQIFKTPTQPSRPPPPPPPVPSQPKLQLTPPPPPQPVVPPSQVIIPSNEIIRNKAASIIQSAIRRKQQLIFNKEEQEIEDAFQNIRAKLLRRNAQRKYNERIIKKKDKQEKYQSFKTLSALIKRKEAQRDYISYLQNEKQLLYSKLNNDVYKEIGKLLQKIKIENEKQYEGNIPDKIKYKRYILDINLNDYLNQALQILDILKSKFNENIEVHLYNIDKFKTEIDDRKHYTREELDAMSMDYIKRLLKYTEDNTAILASTREDIQQYRDVYNAYQRKLRKSISS